MYEGLRQSITETLRTNQDKMDSNKILSKIRTMIEHNSDRDSEHLQMILAIVGFYKNYIGDTKSRLDQALREKKFFELCLSDSNSQALSLRTSNTTLTLQIQALTLQHESSIQNFSTTKTQLLTLQKTHLTHQDQLRTLLSDQTNLTQATKDRELLISQKYDTLLTQYQKITDENFQLTVIIDSLQKDIKINREIGVSEEGDLRDLQGKLELIGRD